METRDPETPEGATTEAAEPKPRKRDRLAAVYQASVTLRTDETGDVIGNAPTVLSIEDGIREALEARFGFKYDVRVAAMRTDR